MFLMTKKAQEAQADEQRKERMAKYKKLGFTICQGDKLEHDLLLLDRAVVKLQAQLSGVAGQLHAAAKKADPTAQDRARIAKETASKLTQAAETMTAASASTTQVAGKVATKKTPRRVKAP